LAIGRNFEYLRSWFALLGSRDFFPKTLTVANVVSRPSRRQVKSIMPQWVCAVFFKIIEKQKQPKREMRKKGRSVNLWPLALSWYENLLSKHFSPFSFLLSLSWVAMREKMDTPEGRNLRLTLLTYYYCFGLMCVLCVYT
jgi:hypothetical protein